MDDDDFLAAVEADNNAAPKEPEPPVEPPKEEPPQEPEQPKEPEAEAPKEPEVLELTEAEQVKKQPEPGYVPIGVVLDTRDKARAAEERAKAAEARLAQLEQQVRQPVERPDEYEDPDGARAYDQAQVAQALQSIALNTSEQFARFKYKDEVVDAAKAWALERFKADPLYQQQVLSDPNPYDRTVKDYQREQLFSQVKDPTEFEQFKAWKEAQNQLQTQPAPQGATPATPPSPIPSPSLASAPSAGGILTEPIQSDEEIFDEVVGKRK